MENKAGFLCRVEEGSEIALWPSIDAPEALLIVHPNHAPRLVSFDGTETELTMRNGVLMMPVTVKGDGTVSYKNLAKPDASQDEDPWSLGWPAAEEIDPSVFHMAYPSIQVPIKKAD